MLAPADQHLLRKPHSLICAALMLALALIEFSTSPLYAEDPGGSTSPGPRITAGSLRDFFERRVPEALRQHAVAGATVSVVHRGQIVYSQGFGFADRGAEDSQNPTPVDADRHLFRAASISKLFTWTAVMQLVEAGQLDLDADINEYLQRVPGGYLVPETEFSSAPIRLRDLLSHSPGYADRVINLFTADPANKQTLRESVDVRPPPRVLPPGAEIAYSNYGSILAGYIVEIVSGQPFEEYVAAKIFAPLGMQSASFVQPLPAPLKERLSQGYVYAGLPPDKNAGDSEAVKEPDPELFQSQVFEIIQGTPAGGLSISATDMARFLAAHLNGGRGILRPESVRQMHTTLLRPDPRLNGFAHGFMELDSHGQRMIGHGGDTIFFHSVAALLPEHDLGFFIATNTSTGALAVHAIKRALLDHYFPAAPTGQALAEQRAPDAGQLSEYVGHYLPNRHPANGPGQLVKLVTALDVEPNSQGDGLLIRDMLSGEQLDCVAVDGDVFQERDGRLRFGFLRDDTGQVRSLVLNEFAVMYFHRPAWHEWPPLHYGVLIVSGGLLLLAMIVRPTGLFAVLSRRYRTGLDGDARRAGWLGTGIVAGYLVFLIVIVAFSASIEAIMSVPPRWPLYLPFVPLLFSLAALLHILPAWTRGYWSTSVRVFYTAFVLASFALFWFLHYWGLTV